MFETCNNYLLGHILWKYVSWLIIIVTNTATPFKVISTRLLKKINIMNKIGDTANYVLSDYRMIIFNVNNRIKIPVIHHVNLILN